MTTAAAQVELSERAAAALDALDESNLVQRRVIGRRVHALRPLLLADCLHGEVVRKQAIPAQLRSRYGIENLYVEDLPDFWRLLYTIVKRQGTNVVAVIEIVDHEVYSRWFPGKGR